MTRKLIPAALCIGAVMLTAGCSKSTTDSEASSPSPVVTEAPAPEAPEEEPAPVADEVSVSMAPKYSQWTNSTNAVLMITAETDGVEIKTLRINGGDCSIVSKQHRDLLNAGQQNTYTVSPLCSPETVRRVDVSTSRGTTTFNF